jgi:hypothetical protein
MAGLVYILCSLTSLGCSVLLWRAYRGSAVKLLFWGGVCFALAAVENAFLYCDREVFHDIDLSVPRLSFGLAALVALLYGMVKESI